MTDDGDGTIDHDHFSGVVRHHGFIRGHEVEVWTPGDGDPETLEPGRGILFTIVGTDVSDSSSEWERVRWEVLRVLYLWGESMCITDLLDYLDDDDHKYVTPSIGWHRNFGNVIATRCDCGRAELMLTPQGVRVARSN